MSIPLYFLLCLIMPSDSVNSAASPLCVSLRNPLSTECEFAKTHAAQ